MLNAVHFFEKQFRGFFKGMGSPLVGVAVVNALLFGVYGAILQAQLDHPSDKPTLWQIFIAGSGSGIVNSLIRHARVSSCCKGSGMI